MNKLQIAMPMKRTKYLINNSNRTLRKQLSHQENSSNPPLIEYYDIIKLNKRRKKFNSLSLICLSYFPL